MFITDAVLNGLPPHIAQVIAGHRDIGVTMGYKAVYPDEAITAHLAFLARRRALRPTEEYRQPTDEEWQQFLGHFERRKVSIGTCGRAFGDALHPRTRLRPLRFTLARPSTTQSSRRDPRQPKSPHRRSRTRTLARRDRRPPSQPRRRREQTHPNRRALQYTEGGRHDRPRNPQSPNQTGPEIGIISNKCLVQRIRAGPPARPATVLSPSRRRPVEILPVAPAVTARKQCRGAPSHVPYERSRPGSRRLHAGHRLANKRAPARLIPGQS